MATKNSFNSSKPVQVAFGGTGQSSLTSGGLVVGNGTGSMQTVSGSSGQVLVGTGSTPVFSATPSVTSITINNAPVANSDGANKAYADLLSAGFSFEAPCVAATTSNLSATYNNGVAGVGGTLTNNSTQAVFSIDDVSPSATSRVLIKNQSTAAQNGIYTVTDVGSVSTNWVLTRATNYDAAAEITPGDYVVVTSGTTNDNSSWLQTATVTTVGTDAITFEAFNVPASYVQTVTTDSGTAMPSSSNLNIYGGANINSSASGNSVTITLDTDPNISGTLTVSSGAIISGGIDIDGNTSITGGNVDIGTDAASHNITIGNQTGTTGVTLKAGSGGVLAKGVATISVANKQYVTIDTSTGQFGSDAVTFGDVVGPASSTDNAIVRFDGTTGKLLQNSAVTIADTTGTITLTSGNLALPQSISAGTAGIISYGGTRCITSFPSDSNMFLGANAGNLSYTASSGINNFSLGNNSLLSLTTGTNNSALGSNSLSSLTTGTYNIAIGSLSGSSLNSSESSNIYINHSGVASESNTLRIGSASGTGVTQLNKVYIAGIDGRNVGAVAKVVTMNGDQLGTASILAGSNISITPGANSITIASTGGGSGITSIAMQIFTASGTYTPTSGMEYCIIEIQGAGGGGGGSSTSSGNFSSCGGGGSGAYARILATAAQIGASATITVGSAGSGGVGGGVSGSTGGSGSASSVAASAFTQSVGGGLGGGGAGNTTNGVGGSGGSGGTATLNALFLGIGFVRNGGTGTLGFDGLAGDGASSILGSGGAGGAAGGAATSAQGFGAGGGGGAKAQAGAIAASGNSGSNGVVIITEFI